MFQFEDGRTPTLSPDVFFHATRWEAFRDAGSVDGLLKDALKPDTMVAAVADLARCFKAMQLGDRFARPENRRIRSLIIGKAPAIIEFLFNHRKDIDAMDPLNSSMELQQPPARLHVRRYLAYMLAVAESQQLSALRKARAVHLFLYLWALSCTFYEQVYAGVRITEANADMMAEEETIDNVIDILIQDMGANVLGERLSTGFMTDVPDTSILGLVASFAYGFQRRKIELPEIFYVSQNNAILKSTKLKNIQLEPGATNPGMIQLLLLNMTLLIDALEISKTPISLLRAICSNGEIVLHVAAGIQFEMHTYDDPSSDLYTLQFVRSVRKLCVPLDAEDARAIVVKTFGDKNNDITVMLQKKAGQSAETMRKFMAQRWRSLLVTAGAAKGCDYAGCKMYAKETEKPMFKCQGCRGVQYCDATCQMKHWKGEGCHEAHKSVCKEL